MAQQNAFDKSKFSLLIKAAMGNRNMSEYSLHSGVSLTYISRLIRQLVEKPPQPITIKKLASRAHNGVTYTDLMVAAGHIVDINRSYTEEDNNNDLIDLIHKSEYYDGIPLDQDDRKRIRMVLDVVFYYAKSQKNIKINEG